MAGIGFELKKLFDRSGLLNKVRAFAYSSLITIGPMIVCIALVLLVQYMLIQYNVAYLQREIFLGCIVYSFVFSYIATNFIALFVTRAVSDFIYEGYFGALLPSYYGSLKFNYVVSSIPCLIFLYFSGLTLPTKTAVFVLFMLLITIWTQTIFISAMKDFRRIALAFVIGGAVSLLATLVLLKWMHYRSVEVVLFAVDGGFAVTACSLQMLIVRFFKTEKSFSSMSFLAYIHKYPSLIAIGLLSASGLYSHQFLHWFGPDGRLVGGVFLMDPDYDIAVYYAFISAIPTIIMFVVSLETVFYSQIRRYYHAILTSGPIVEINRSRGEMNGVLVQQLSMIMGVQFFFTMLAIALGIRFLPYIGFTSLQVDVYNILVMGFFAYITYTVISLILLYFDDRKGVLWLAGGFLLLNTGFTAISMTIGEQGFSFFLASFAILLLAFARLKYLMDNLNYFTFSAQPLSVKKQTNKFTRMLEQGGQIK